MKQSHSVTLSNSSSEESISLGNFSIAIPSIQISPASSPSPKPSIQTISEGIRPQNINYSEKAITSDKNFKDQVDKSKSTVNRTRIFVKKLFRRKNIERTFPILKWGPKYNYHTLLSDTVAGVTVALTVLPQGLAYATVAGLPPIYGLYSSFIGPFVYIIFGSTKAISIGPAAIQSILTYKYTEGRPPEYAVFLCFVTALVTLFMGIFRLGFISNFISAPVLSAFTSAVAITIIATQLKPLLGLSLEYEGFIQTIQGLFNRFDTTKKRDSILSLSCCVILILMKYLEQGFHCKSYPRVNKVIWLISVSKSALVMLCSTLLVAYSYPNHGVSIVGPISAGLPPFKPPPLEIYSPAENRTHTFTEILREEASAMFVVPLLGVIGHCTIAKVFSGTDRVDAAQEILVIGISNAISCFFSSMPVGGSFSRTTVNAQSGVQTPAGGFITGIIVILALKYLTPYFFYIPKASLASVICVSCIYMVNPYIILPLWRSKKMDLIPWAVTFLVTLFGGLEYGITIGILISAFFLLFYSARPRVKVGTRQTPKGTVFIYILLDRSLTFPSVDYITNQIIKAASNLGSTDTPVVVDCHHIQYADFTAAEGVRDLIINMNNMGYKIFFWKVKTSIYRVINGAMLHNHVPFLRCNTEEELDAVVDGIERRLTMFHPLSLISEQLLLKTKERQERKGSDSSITATTAVSTGIFV